MDENLLRPGWSWFRFQKIWIKRRNPESGFGQSTDCLRDLCDVVLLS